MNPLTIARWMQRILGGALLILLVVACAADPEPPAAGAVDENTPTPQHPKLVDTEWLLLEWGPAGALVKPVEGTLITLLFSHSEVSGSSGCNGYGATYTVDSNRITFDTSDFMTTLMACEPAVMEQEHDYLTALQTAESYTLSEDRLTIHTPTVDLVYQLKQLTDQVLLEDIVWYLTSLATGETVQSVLAGTEVTLTLTDDRAAGNGGCNQYFSNYQLSSGSLTFGPVGATRMACEEGIMAQENAYFKALAGVTGYALTSDTLTLHYADGQLIFSARRPLPGNS